MLSKAAVEIDMHSVDRADLRGTGIPGVLKTQEDRTALQQHLNEVMEGAAFKGSRRSGQFLRYIVDQAIAGNFESLKERIIGIELWGKPPSYDTTVDAIVRVTASDVRKRLLRHYEQSESASEFRILLPPGSYVPEIIPTHSKEDDLEVAAPAVPFPDNAREGQPLLSSSEPPTLATSHFPPEARPQKLLRNRPLFCAALVLVGLSLAMFCFFRIRSAAGFAAAGAVPGVPPWSLFFKSPHSLQLIASDPDIAEVEEYTDTKVSLSDYANHNYIHEPSGLNPKTDWLVHVILQENQASSIDMPIAVNLAEMAQRYGKQVDVRGARSIQMTDLQTDDNFILLGSPLSDPWADFFSNALDFRFAWDKGSSREIIRNFRPQAHEQTEYVPTALGHATGESYAIVGFVQNPDQNGDVLLLAGASAEGTEAAEKLVTDMPRLSAVLQKCRILPTGPLQHFELLLQLNMMTDSPSKITVAACHILRPASSSF